MDHQSKGYFSFYRCLELNDKKIQGVTAPIVGTSSLENLYDLLGMVYFIFLSDLWVIF